LDFTILEKVKHPKSSAGYYERFTSKEIKMVGWELWKGKQKKILILFG